VALGAAALVLAYACFLLKPSWYLATATTAAPVLVGVFGRSLHLKARLLTPALGAALSILVLWLPQRVLFIRDGASVTLLPMALFYVHAQLVEKSLDAKVAALPDSDPGKSPLQNLNEVLKSETRNSKNHQPYARLGINPDYLLDSHTMNKALFDCAGHDVKQIKSFCFAEFRDAVFFDPKAYANKVLTQFAYFLVPPPKTFFKEHIDLRREYQESASAMPAHRPTSWPSPAEEMELRYEHDLADRIETTPATPPKSKHRALTKALARWSPPVAALSVIFLLVLVATLKWSVLRKLRLAGWGAFILFLAPFGNALGVCIVHALDIERYRVTLAGYLFFALSSMLVFTFVVIAKSLQHNIEHRGDEGS
jgi:hypothetical protein